MNRIGEDKMAKQICWLFLFSLFLSGCHLLPAKTPSSSTQTNMPSSTETSTPEIQPSVYVKETASLSVTATQSPLPDYTQTPSFVSSTAPTIQVQNTLTPTLVIYAYHLQVDTPKYIQNFGHLDNGCNWLGVAGQVFDKSGNTVNKVVVSISGTLNNRNIDLLTITGLPQSSIYGPGGFEIALADYTMDSLQPLTIRLFDLNGAPLSPGYTFNTFKDCSSNLIIINFQAIK
jgi:hypothetical protein